MIFFPDSTSLNWLDFILRGEKSLYNNTEGSHSYTLRHTFSCVSLRQVVESIGSLKLENNMRCHMFWLADDNKYMPCEDVWVIKGVLWGFINVRKAKKVTSFMHTKISRHHLSPKHTYRNTFSSIGTIKWNRQCWEALEMLHEIRYVYLLSFAPCSLDMFLGNSLEHTFFTLEILFIFISCELMFNLHVDLC